MVISIGRIRFSENTSPPKLWKLAENLIDFGGHGHVVVHLDHKIAQIKNDYKKQSFCTPVIQSGVKVAILGCLFFSVIGAVFLIGVITYHRKQYQWTQEPSYTQAPSYAKKMIISSVPVEQKKSPEIVNRLSAYEQISVESYIGNYYASGPGNTHWRSFYLLENKERIDDKFKFHISVKRTKDTMERAFNLIFPILVKYKIATFKIVPTEKIDNKQRNPLGKEFTIYIQEYEMESLPLLINEIVESLKNNKIENGVHPQADRILQGSAGFIGVRSSTNFLGEYIEADELARAGFTDEEAAKLSPCAWDTFEAKKSNDRVPSEVNILRQHIPKTDSKDLAGKLESNGLSYYESFKKDLFDDMFVSLILGPVKSMATFECNEKIKTLCAAFGVRVENPPMSEAEKKNNKILRDAINYFVPNEAFFEHYFVKAAVMLDTLQLPERLQDVGNEKKKNKTGNILPALYHHCIYPLFKKLKGDVQPVLNQAEQENLICQIVLCALRTRVPFPQPVNSDKLAGYCNLLLNKPFF